MWKLVRGHGGGTADGLTPADAFSILGNEIRVGVLRALWESDRPLAFAELRRQVVSRDTGNFNYHLRQLVDHFVRETDAGYELQFAGEQIIRAVMAGTITGDAALAPREIDERCAYCGGTVEMAYEEEVISVRCTDCAGVVDGDLPHGTFVHYGFPPAGIEDRSPEEAVDAAHVLYDAKVAPMMKGICPECAGHVTVEFDVCPDHCPDEDGRCGTCETRFSVWSVYQCDHCKYRRKSAMWFAALNHPAVIAFYNDHGLEETLPFRKLTADNAEYVRDVTGEVVETDPYRFRVTIPMDEEVLVVRLDDDLDVTDVHRMGASMFEGRRASSPRSGDV